MKDNFISPFLTYYRENSDYNLSDASNEFQLLVERNNAIDSLLCGDIKEDYLFDLLAEQNIEPSAYTEAVESEISYLMNNPHLLYS